MEAVGGEGEGVWICILTPPFKHALHPVDAADLNASLMPPTFVIDVIQRSLDEPGNDIDSFNVEM